jgi:hypothetical protein
MKRIFIGLVTGILTMGLHAETIRVLRFVPLSGAETEVAVESLRKVVFTPDSIVLIAAKDGQTTPMYKYDYQAIEFDQSSTPTGVKEVGSETVNTVRSEKFLRNGQLFIRLDGHVYNILGGKVL